MKIIQFLFVVTAGLFPAISQAQDLDNKILMTVGENKVQAGEFIRMYNKSVEPGKTPDVDEYLQQYMVFKQKVADAVDEGIDTTRAFKNELAGYRNQLAQNYLTDTQVREKLLQKAYQRSLTEINAWHILVTLKQNSTPEDTLEAWKKASDIRERILSGEPFEQVARGTSDDPSVKVNGGNLGYFTVFQMIMPFEDAVYSMKKGALSAPVRTPYGYHIIKVVDKRPSKGKIKVAIIMKAAPPTASESEISRAEEEINYVYKKLKEGDSFKELAKKFSDHKESALRGGELNWFGTGEIISDLSEAAFSLTDTGSFTKPVRTLYGWNIIKLLDKKANGSFEESRSYIESKLNQSYLNSLSKKSFIGKLKKEYKFKIDQEAYNWFVSKTDTLVIKGLKKIDRSDMPEGNLYTFATQHYSTKEFANYIEKRASMIITNDSSVFISSALETRVNDHMISYENSVLEKKYPEFRYLMNEFHDGILLFEISGKKVWNRVNEDSAGIRRYYEENKNKFLTPPAIEAKIYSLKSPGGEKLLSSAFKKFSEKPDMDKRLIEKFNKGNDTLLLIKDGKWFRGNNSEIDNLQWIKGNQTFLYNGNPSIIVINKIIDQEPLKFDEVQGEIMLGYQKYLEDEWIRQLKGKYIVKVNDLTLEEVRKKVKNE